MRYIILTILLLFLTACAQSPDVIDLSQTKIEIDNELQKDEKDVEKINDKIRKYKPVKPDKTPKPMVF